MKTLILLASFAFLFVLSSCQTTSTTTGTESYAGTWRVVFRGDLEGSGLLYINDNGSFTSSSFRLRNVYNNTFIDLAVSGAVNLSSIRNGNFIRNNAEVGDFDGSFFKFTGSGNYNLLENLTGTWNASKN